jgi:hypothetical protein
LCNFLAAGILTETDQRMKQPLFLVLFLGLSLFCRAQNAGTASGLNKIQITVSNEHVTLVAQDKSFTLGSLPALDSCLRQIIPSLGHPTIQVGSEDGTDRERMRQVAVILEAFHCPVISSARRTTAPPPAVSRKADSSGH